MTRRVLIERIRRQIYGGQPSADSSISANLVNNWLNDAIALAAKQNYKENIAIEGIGYINNSFYTIFKGLSITYDEQFLWKVTLPQIPLGIGEFEGISTIQVKDNSTPQISFPVILMSQNQRSFHQGMRDIPNKVIGYSQGGYIYLESTLGLGVFTAYVTMVSGGDSTDLSSQVNIPDDYFPVMIEYIKQQLGFEKAQPVDRVDDGQDVNPTA